MRKGDRSNHQTSCQRSSPHANPNPITNSAGSVLVVEQSGSAVLSEKFAAGAPSVHIHSRTRDPAASTSQSRLMQNTSSTLCNHRQQAALSCVRVSSVLFRLRFGCFLPDDREARRSAFWVGFVRRSSKMLAPTGRWMIIDYTNLATGRSGGA